MHTYLQGNMIEMDSAAALINQPRLAEVIVLEYRFGRVELLELFNAVPEGSEVKLALHVIVEGAVVGAHLAVHPWEPVLRQKFFAESFLTALCSGGPGVFGLKMRMVSGHSHNYKFTNKKFQLD